MSKKMSEGFTHGYALLIGVGQSDYPQWSLPVTVKDMQAIHALLTDANFCAYPSDEQHIRLLHDASATRNKILEGLSWLKTQAENDKEATIIVYYSGHGWVDGSTNKYYLISSDVKPSDIPGSALPADLFTTALHKINAKRLLVIIDSCHAEGMATTKKDVPGLELPDRFTQKALPDDIVKTLKQGEGRAVFTSSRGEQPSWTRPDNTMSIYTYHLIEAFHGASNKPGNKVVRVFDLMTHLSTNVPKSALELRGAEQTPFFDIATENFPVAMLRGGKDLPIDGGESKRNEDNVQNIEQRVLRNRQMILDRVKNNWVKDIPRDSLPVMIDLGLETRPDAVIRPWDMELQTENGPNRQLAHGTKIINVFNDEASQALLILGEPGSGKTTTLLDLARDTIDFAEKEPTQHIPVVFNLSSWANKKLSIEEWLIEELNTKYYITEKLARSWVEKDDLLLLLDGLDEVKKESRNACVEAINKFRKQHGVTPLAICSRIKDYDELSTQLELQTAVLLKPLTDEQIEQYLTHIEKIDVEKVDFKKPDLSTVREMLKRDAAFHESAKSPLMLNIMISAYQNKSAENVQSMNTLEERRQHLFDTYVARMFERRGKKQPYTPEQTINWLKWLAKKLDEYKQTEFLIEQLQPTWLTQNDRIWTHITSKLTVGLIIGMVVFMVVDHADLLARLYYGFSIGLISGLFAMPNSVKITEVLKWSWIKAIKMAIFGLFIGLLGVLVSIVIEHLEISFGDKLVVGLFVALSVGLIVGLVNSSWRIGINTGIVVGIFFGLGVWLFGFAWSAKEIFDWCNKPGAIAFLGLAGGIFGGITHLEIENKIVPNQGIQRSIRNAFLVGATTSTTFGIIIGLFSDLMGLETSEGSGVIFGGGIGLILGILFFGGIAVILHFTIRYFLWCKGYIPWRYAHFLDYASERILLRKVGGSYIFIHRLLLEHFAASKSQEAAQNKKTKCGFLCRWRICALPLIAGIVLTLSIFNMTAIGGLSGFYILRGNVYELRLKDDKQALSNYSKAIELNPNNGEAYLYRGKIYLEQKKCDRAMNDFNQAIVLDNDNVDAFIGLGFVYLHCYESSKPEQAITFFKKAIDLNNYYAIAFAMLGKAYYKNKNYEEALKNFNRALKLDKTVDWAYIYRGLIYQHRENYVEALMDFNHAVKLEGVHYKIAKDGQTQTYELAIAHYTKAIERDPNQFDLYFDRGRIHKIQGEKEKAKADFERGLKLTTDPLLVEKVQKEIQDIQRGHKSYFWNEGFCLNF